MTTTVAQSPSPRSSESKTGESETGEIDAPAMHPGLAGVVLSSTVLSRVDGAAGELVLAGFAIEDIAPHATFEEAAWLLMTGELPTSEDLSAMRGELAERRGLPAVALEVLEAAAAGGLSPMAALPMAAATIAVGQAADEASGTTPFSNEELTILARLPRLVAAYARLRSGSLPIRATTEGSLSRDFLFALKGQEPSTGAVRALDTYLVTVADHGANASTFAARVIVSTGAGTLESILGALGALSGPLHGGAPGPALDMVKEIARPEAAEAALRTRLDRGERLMGFGHRVYKVRDPRAEVLSQAAKRLYQDPSSGADPSLYELTRHVEDVAVRLLDEYKPGRRLRANVELYTALLLDGLGLESELFTPVFAMARTAGWLAHGREQRLHGKLIRPRLHYAGTQGRHWPAAVPSS